MTPLASGILALWCATSPTSPLAPHLVDRIDPTDRVDVRMDTTEAEAVLHIVSLRQSGTAIAPADWRALFESVGYIRLKKREAAMRRRFEDADFQQFVLPEDVQKRAAALRATLEAWQRADLTAAGSHALTYLPSSAQIHATIYPVIKPRENSFVVETDTDPAIFLYIDPAKTKEQFQNTVAHELHHVGAGSLELAYEASLRDLAPPARVAARWMGAFAEGIAMLAAAGGPDRHPHATSPDADRARWDRDVVNFDQDLRRVEHFFLDIIHDRLKGDDAIGEAASGFFGVQGPWYTVGWKMATIVEQTYGRDAVIEAVRDPRSLLTSYNRAVRERHLELPMWSAELLAAVGKP
jgi:hypothetical protein